jgi:tetratricopeptide (TPR) repeat protein
MLVASQLVEEGEKLFQVKKFEESLDRFVQAISADPKSGSAQRGAGFACIELGRYDKAIEHFNESIKIHPGNVKAQFGTGLALQRAGRLEEAAEALQRTLTLSPDFKPARHLMAQVEIERAKNATDDPRIAEDLLSHAVEADPRAVAPAKALAEHHMRNGEPQKALRVVESAISNIGEHPDLVGLRTKLAPKPAASPAPTTPVASVPVAPSYTPAPGQTVRSASNYYPMAADAWQNKAYNVVTVIIALFGVLNLLEALFWGGGLFGYFIAAIYFGAAWIMYSNDETYMLYVQLFMVAGILLNLLGLFLFVGGATLLGTGYAILMISITILQILFAGFTLYLIGYRTNSM